MTKKKYDRAIIIGRFQPFHNGHLKLVEQAQKIAEKVIILVGSSDSSVSTKNPFTFEQRKTMIQSCVDVTVLPLNDYSYNDQKWVKQVRDKVESVPIPWSDTYPVKTCMVGYKKDHSSFYLDLFPDWDFVSVDFDDRINATDIRNIIFNDGKAFSLVHGVLPECIRSYIKDVFFGTEQCKNLVEEYWFLKDYKSQFASLRYPPVFVTTDAVVVQSGHILLIERKAAPGKGLLALPGGFVNPNERLQSAMIRELREETKIRVPAPVLIGSIKNTHVFDDPDRSARGRTITHAYYIELMPTEDGKLPVVKGADDAKTAKWYPLNEVKSTDMFEDHAQIISYFTSI